MCVLIVCSLPSTPVLIRGLAQKLNNLNGPGSEADGLGQIWLQVNLYLKFAYKTSNYEKVMYAISV